jgi:glycosyltransferase involved in cell wall biosynthesis
VTAISVCMASYQGLPYLREQVDSILAQLGPDDELVVSDNGSTDGTYEYLAALADPRLRLVRYEERRGPVPNFENALRLATRPVIVLVDQDDLWLPNRLPLVRSAFEGAGPGLLCLVADGERIDGEGRLLAASNLEVLRYRPGLWKNLYKNSFMGCAMAFRRELLEVALPFPATIPMHDSWLGILAGHFGAVRMSREPSYRYRVHAKNASQRRNPAAGKVAHRARLAGALLGRLAAVRLRRALGLSGRGGRA